MYCHFANNADVQSSPTVLPYFARFEGLVVTTAPAASNVKK